MGSNNRYRPLISIISHFARRSVHSKAIAPRGADVESVTNIQKRLTRTPPVAVLIHATGDRRHEGLSYLNESRLGRERNPALKCDRTSPKRSFCERYLSLIYSVINFHKTLRFDYCTWRGFIYLITAVTSQPRCRRYATASCEDSRLAQSIVVFSLRLILRAGCTNCVANGNIGRHFPSQLNKFSFLCIYYSLKLRPTKLIKIQLNVRNDCTFVGANHAETEADLQVN